MVAKDAGNTSDLLCPKCDSPWIHYLMCSNCGYDEGTPI